VTGDLHKELCKQGDRWLKKTVGCSLSISELVCSNSYGEIPDNIGWKSGYSILIECKTSRSDFKVDAKKIFRQFPEFGMGQLRLYLCPDGLIKPEELPEGWGLLYYSPNRKTLKRIECFKGNIVSESGNLKFQKSHIKSERSLLLSYIRRLK
jgi:hypothetical protein